MSRNDDLLNPIHCEYEKLTHLHILQLALPGAEFISIKPVALLEIRGRDTHDGALTFSLHS